jgi:hypothetical protein
MQFLLCGATLTAAYGETTSRRMPRQISEERSVRRMLRVKVTTPSQIMRILVVKSQHLFFHAITTSGPETVGTR